MFVDFPHTWLHPTNPCMVRAITQAMKTRARAAAAAGFAEVEKWAHASRRRVGFEARASAKEDAALEAYEQGQRARSRDDQVTPLWSNLW